MRVIIKPLITEKHSALSEEQSQYGFVVDRKANKHMIRQEVEKLYGVDVLQVRTMNYKPKKKVRYTKRNILRGEKSSYKKAIVSIKEGETIDFYSNL